MIDFVHYQAFATRTVSMNVLNLSNEGRVSYFALGAAGEAGEIANKTKKLLRGDKNQQELCADMVQEIGDVLWYLAMLCNELKLDLGTIADLNLKKLADRQVRGVIGGSGDNR